MSRFFLKCKYHTWRAVSLLALIGIFSTMFGCGIHIPPAQQPELVSTGLEINGSGGRRTIGALNAYCNDYTISEGQYGRGFYLTIRMPALNHPEVTFAGIPGDFWGNYIDPTHQSLSQGPRPITQQQVQNLQGNYVGYFIHDDFLTGNDYHVVLGILLGKGVSESGMLEIRSTNNDPKNTSFQARSDPLELTVVGPVRITANLSSATVNESQPLTVSWNASNADQVQVTGPEFQAEHCYPLVVTRL